MRVHSKEMLATCKKIIYIKCNKKKSNKKKRIEY